MKNENLPLTPELLPNNNFDIKTELFIDHQGLLIYQPGKSNITWTDCKYQQLYITSKRDIARDNYFLCSGRIQKALKVDSGYVYGNDTTEPINLCSKIEFTTDSILIADGVPAIDGNTKAWIKKDLLGAWHDKEVNFLEEFVKHYNQNYNHEFNPSRTETDYCKCGRPINHSIHQKGFDVEKFANEYSIRIEVGSDSEYVRLQKAVEYGYNQAIQSNAGVFSFEDIFSWINKNGKKISTDEEFVGIDKYEFKKYLKSIIKPQSKGDIVIVSEMEEIIWSMNVNPTTVGQMKIKLINGQPILIFK